MIFGTLLIAIGGLIIGSFLGVVTYRLPKGQNFVKGRSLCPQCGKVIAWFDNLPLVSFIWLGGKCRSCGRKIALRYPAIEIVTAIGFVGLFGLLADCRGGTICFWQDSYPTLGATLLFILLAITICIFVIDLEKRIIPDELIFAGFLLIVVPLALGTNGDLFRHLFGAFSAALFLLALHLLTKGKGMGLGDVKYGLLAGLFLGWPLSLLWLYLAFLTGAATAIILILAGKAKRRDKIAFGPFLALAFAITAVWGLEISRWLLP